MADALADAQALYRESLDALSEQRRQVMEDLQFSDPSDPLQWDPELKRRREGDPGGKRPCLVHDQCGQYVANVAGQIESQPPSLHAIPVNGGATKEAAEQIDGRFRHIEHASRAMQHYARALTSAARTGVGYLVVRPDYVDVALNWQEPRIGSEPDPLKVVFDPWSVETDGSDATFGFILTAVSVATFKRRWPKKDTQDFGDIETTSKRDARKSVLTAEYWSQSDEQETTFIYQIDGEETSGDMDEYSAACLNAGTKIPIIRQEKTKQTSIKWCRMSGADVLEETEYPASSIGIVPVYGYVGFSDGRMRYCGIPRRARAPQQAYNYHVSEQLAYIGTAPKAPWLASKRALAGVETIWDRASIEARAYLPYNDLDEDGAISQPARTNIATSLVNHEAGATAALRDIQASIGMYQANIGAQSNVVSGVAYDSQKQQGEASTAHFPAHMAASLGQVGKIVMEMDAELCDARRTQPIIGVDESAGHVQVDPNQKEAFMRLPDGAGVSINPNIGKYGVRVIVGASYATQRKETNAAFVEMMRANPTMAPVMGPFWAQTLDFPGSDKFAQAMAAMAPPAIKSILQPEGGKNAPDPAMLSQQLQQSQQALQEAIQHAKAAQDDADQAVHGEAQAKQALADQSEQIEIDKYNAETNRLKVTGANTEQIQVVVQQLINDMLSQQAPLPGDDATTGTDPATRQPAVPAGPTTAAPMPAGVAPTNVAPVDGGLPTNQGTDMGEQQYQELSANVQQLAHGQQQLADLMEQLKQVAMRTRKRVPVRDKQGNITHVIDQVVEEGN